MTWHEFKLMVEVEIYKAGETEAVEIEYIDTGTFPNRVDIFVHPFQTADWRLLPEKTTLAVQG